MEPKKKEKREFLSIKSVPKCPSRLRWERQLHQRFLEAITELGEKKATPSQILKYMSVEGLTRFHVSSHLQQYRLEKRGVKPTRRKPAAVPPPTTSTTTTIAAATAAPTTTTTTTSAAGTTQTTTIQLMELQYDLASVSSVLSSTTATGRNFNSSPLPPTFIPPPPTSLEPLVLSELPATKTQFQPMGNEPLSDSTPYFDPFTYCFQDIDFNSNEVRLAFEQLVDRLLEDTPTNLDSSDGTYQHNAEDFHTLMSV